MVVVEVDMEVIEMTGHISRGCGGGAGGLQVTGFNDALVGPPGAVRALSTALPVAPVSTPVMDGIRRSYPVIVLSGRTCTVLPEWTIMPSFVLELCRATMEGKGQGGPWSF